MKKKRDLPSLQTRLLLSNIGVVLLAFLIVILGFSFLMDRYVSSTATNQLSAVVADQSSNTDLPNLTDALTGDFNLRPKTFDITTTYAIKLPSGATDYDHTNAKEIAATLKARNLSLANLSNRRIFAGEGVFYLQTVKLSASDYSLFYVDVTGIINFSNRVNLYLILIALIVILLGSLGIIFVTRSITRPLANLAAFAKQIGQGNFTTNEKLFKIHEFEQLSDNLNETAVQLDRVDQDQKTFFQNASHELRTPLMSIKSYAEGIKYEVMAPKEASEVILNETDRMTELVEDLLTISRLDSLKTPADLVKQDCRELMADLAKEQKPLAQARGLEFVLELDKKPVELEMNYKAMRRAISNLSSNSLRYARKKISFVCQNTATGGVLLAVKNDGEPISDTDLSHLFERFYKGKGGVHGIGLAIVKSIVEQHGGVIEVESNDEETAFTMTFGK